MNNEEIIVKIGLKIRELRENKNLSLMDFSFMLDIEYNNLIRIEKGRTNPTLKILIKISRALDIPLKELVDVE